MVWEMQRLLMEPLAAVYDRQCQKDTPKVKDVIDRRYNT
jgi:hypothetical protein